VPGEGRKPLCKEKSKEDLNPNGWFKKLLVLKILGAQIQAGKT